MRKNKPPFRKEVNRLFAYMIRLENELSAVFDEILEAKQDQKNDDHDGEIAMQGASATSMAHHRPAVASSSSFSSSLASPSSSSPSWGAAASLATPFTVMASQFECSESKLLFSGIGSAYAHNHA
jgi:hypothetical protein